MHDDNPKWWDHRTHEPLEREGCHDLPDCDCLECKLSRLEGSFHEITRQLRKFLRDRVDDNEP